MTHRFNDLRGLVLRSIIDDQNFNVPVGLTNNRIQCLIDKTLSVVGRNYNRNQRGIRIISDDIHLYTIFFLQHT